MTRWAAFLAAHALAGVCFAGTIAVTPATGIAGFDARPFMVGFQFSVSSTITIDGLAYLDPFVEGLGEDHRVGIFNSSDGSLLLSAVVPAGPATPLIDGFWRVAPVTPYALTPGVYVIGGQQSGAVADEVVLFAPFVFSIPEVAYLEERELQAAAFAMPTGNEPLNELGIFGPSFTVAVPEPSAWWLVGLALLVVVSGGGRGIRTPGGLSTTAVFKTAALNHSAIPPIPT